MAPGTASTMTGASSPSVRSSTLRDSATAVHVSTRSAVRRARSTAVASRSFVGAGQLQEVVDQCAEAVGLLDRGVELR